MSTSSIEDVKMGYELQPAAITRSGCHGTSQTAAELGRISTAKWMVIATRPEAEVIYLKKKISWITTDRRDARYSPQFEALRNYIISMVLLATCIAAWSIGWLLLLQEVSRLSRVKSSAQTSDKRLVQMLYECFGYRSSQRHSWRVSVSCIITHRNCSQPSVIQRCMRDRIPLHCGTAACHSVECECILWPDLEHGNLPTVLKRPLTNPPISTDKWNSRRFKWNASIQQNVLKQGNAIIYVGYYKKLSSALGIRFWKRDQLDARIFEFYYEARFEPRNTLR